MNIVFSGSHFYEKKYETRTIYSKDKISTLNNVFEKARHWQENCLFFA